MYYVFVYDKRTRVVAVHSTLLTFVRTLRTIAAICINLTFRKVCQLLDNHGILYILCHYPISFKDEI